MIEISYLREKEILRTLPKEVGAVVLRILQILDTEYGENRNKYADDGGYVIIAENLEDLQQVSKNTYIDWNDVIPEFTDLIKCESGQVFTNSLILLSSDFSISVVMPLEITPDNLKGYIIE